MQPIDIPGSIMRGQSNALALGQQQQEIAAQNRLRQVYQEHGPGIAKGNANALAQLAQVDPMQAYTIGRQGRMDAQRAEELEYQRGRDARNDARAEQQFQLQMEQYARSLSAEQRAAEAAEIEDGIVRGTAFYQAGDLRSLNMLLAEAGESPLQSLDQFPALAAQYEKAREVLAFLDDRNAPADEYERYVADETAAGRQPLSRIQFAQAKKGNGVVVTAPDGTTLQVGGGSGGANLNEIQSKNAVFATRARGALDVLEQQVEGQPLADNMKSRVNRGLEFVPFGLGREAQSPEFQVASAAGQEFLQAILRKDTGAAITDNEQVLYGRLYLPQPGDSPEVLEYRRQARQRAVDAIEAGMTPEAMRARELALAQTQGFDLFGGTTPETAQQPADQNETSELPQPGDVVDGYIFLGGDHGDRNAWQLAPESRRGRRSP